MEGFLALQKAVDESIITERNPNADLGQINVQLQRFPYPAYKTDIIGDHLQTLLTLLLFVSFCPAVLCMAEDVIKEKETMLRVIFSSF